ncbi:hypothetical protein NKH77_49015 [Streptomyces sp. M19]
MVGSGRGLADDSDASGVLPAAGRLPRTVPEPPRGRHADLVGGGPLRRLRVLYLLGHPLGRFPPSTARPGARPGARPWPGIRPGWARRWWSGPRCSPSRRAPRGAPCRCSSRACTPCRCVPRSRWRPG